MDQGPMTRVEPDELFVYLGSPTIDSVCKYNFIQGRLKGGSL